MFWGVAILSMKSGRKVELGLIKLGRIEENEKEKKNLRCETESKKRWFQERPYTSFISVCRICVKRGLERRKGRNPQTPNIEGLLLNVREQNRIFEEIDFFLSAFLFSSAQSTRTDMAPFHRL